MTFTPIVPASGYTGWLFLERTIERQRENFENSAEMSRKTDYFAENITKVKTADDLVSDRRLLEVALGAYGLDEDINNTYFIKKILKDGTASDTALANRLADKRYAAFSDAFGFANPIGPKTKLPGFAIKTIALFERKQFEIAIGNQNEDMRLALNAENEIQKIASDSRSNNSKWFSIMGNPPLRAVFETALGLPSSFSQLDLDKQLEVFKDKSQLRFGTSEISDLASDEKQNELIRQFLVRSEINASLNATSPASVALTLLQSV